MTDILIVCDDNHSQNRALKLVTMLEGIADFAIIDTVPLMDAKKVVRSSARSAMVIIVVDELKDPSYVNRVISMATQQAVIVYGKQFDSDKANELLSRGVQEYLTDIDITSAHVHSVVRHSIARHNYLALIETERSTLVKVRQKATVLRRERTHLREVNQAKDDFLSLASHQLRTPATGVKQYVNMILQGYIGPISDEQRSVLELANESNERQLKVVKELLDIARIDAGRTKLKLLRVDMKQLIADVIAEQNNQFTARSQTVLVTTDEGDVSLMLDNDKIRMALENIVDNASKYTEDGKTISISLGKNRRWLVIKIQDEGVGIDKGDLLKVFDKFARITNPLSDDVGGSGLGLYWAKRVVELHEGRISVRSKRNVGTTFEIRLPLKWSNNAQ